MTGIARTITPVFFKTRCDSLINSKKDLKCCADSRAIILSVKPLLNGRHVAVAFTLESTTQSFLVISFLLVTSVITVTEGSASTSLSYPHLLPIERDIFNAW